MRPRTSKLVQRTVRISPNRPGEPREPLFDPTLNRLSWKPPVDDSMVTHYRIRADVEIGAPLFQPPVGQTSVQVGPGVRRLYITAYNQISRKESGHVTVDVAPIPTEPFSDVSLLYELPQMRPARTPLPRTIDIKDSTVGNDIADATTVHSTTRGKSNKCVLVVGVLRAAIAADLTVRLNLWVAGSSSVVGTFTIPHATAVNTAVQFTTFTTSVLPDLSVLTWDITASDGQVVGPGVASFTVWWE